MADKKDTTYDFSSSLEGIITVSHTVVEINLNVFFIKVYRELLVCRTNISSVGSAVKSTLY